MTSTQFKKHVWDYYDNNKRMFPWRSTSDPYDILVSEFMLQQTQTDRVKPKYEAFIQTFPNFGTLALAKQSQVLSMWQGLGYNRRALYLHKTAQHVHELFNGTLPNDQKTLESFPGIGSYTAAAIRAFAFNEPTTVIETNIRTVYIHHFFNDQIDVHDRDLLKIIKDTVDLINPREWYYALMDYGVYLKNIHPNPNRKSKHYTKQSKFEGSDRQIRGEIVRVLLNQKSTKIPNLMRTLDEDPNRIVKIAKSLQSDGFLTLSDNTITLKE